MSDSDNVQKLAIWMIQHPELVVAEFQEKDVIIETMNEAHKCLISEKNDEIERLKAENANLKRIIEDWRIAPLGKYLDKYKTLVIELCDALEQSYWPIAPLDGHEDLRAKHLVQRAREATR